MEGASVAAVAVPVDRGVLALGVHDPHDDGVRVDAGRGAGVVTRVPGAHRRDLNTYMENQTCKRCLKRHQCFCLTQKQLLAALLSPCLCQKVL